MLMKTLNLTLSIKGNNIETIENICNGLSNSERLKSLLLFGDVDHLPLDAFHEKAKKFNIYQNVETSYRNLEILVSSGLLVKTYDINIKKIVYGLDKSIINVIK